jgi:hypothetical protein
MFIDNLMDMIPIPSLVTKETFNLVIAFIAIVLTISSHTKRVIMSTSSRDNIWFAVSIILGVILGLYYVKMGV